MCDKHLQLYFGLGRWDEVSKQIRNEERKRTRLIERARNLSSQDLIDIIGSRAVAKAKAKPKPAPKPKAKPKESESSGRLA